MTRLSKLSAAFLLSASFIAAPAMAQVNLDAGGGAGVGAEVEAEGNVGGATGTNLGVDTDTTASIEPSFDGAISAIDRNSDSAVAISGMTEVGSVNIVRVNELENVDETQLDGAVSENEAAIDELHAAIESNADVMAELEAAGVELDSVVAADIEADGTLTLYVS